LVGVCCNEWTPPTPFGQRVQRLLVAKKSPIIVSLKASSCGSWWGDACSAIYDGSVSMEFFSFFSLFPLSSPWNLCRFSQNSEFVLPFIYSFNLLVDLYLFWIFFFQFHLFGAHSFDYCFFFYLFLDLFFILIFSLISLIFYPILVLILLIVCFIIFLNLFQ
jgi:hypothetical protein